MLERGCSRPVVLKGWSLRSWAAWVSPANLVVVQSLSRVRLFVTPWTVAHQASLSFTISEFAQTYVHWVGDVIQPAHPLPLLLPPSIFASIRIFSSELVLCIRWPEYSNEYSGLISFRIDWLYLLAVQGTLKSLLQHHSSKASILWHSAFFYGPTLTSIHDYWKNHSLD